MKRSNSVLNLHGLQVVILPGAGGTSESRKYYDAAYEVWKSVWKQTLLELDGNESLYSDHFTRQDYILALFHGPTCIALCCFRRADLTRAADIEDSWFKPWPRESLETFGRENKHGIALSWLTIHPDYRRSVMIDHLKELNAGERLSEMTNFFLQECKLDIAFGVTRNNRSVNKLSANVGFKTFLSNVKHHGVDVDLIVLTRDDLKIAALNYPKSAFDIWNQRQVVVSEPLQLSTQADKEKVRKFKLVG